MEEKLTLNRKEQKRLMVLNEVGKGKVLVREAAEVLGLSERQGWRLLAAYRKEGAAGLAHGNRGRKPGHTIPEEICKQVLQLAQTTYAGFNQQHFTDLLGEREGVFLDRSTVRRILLQGGIRSPQPIFAYIFALPPMSNFEPKISHLDSLKIGLWAFPPVSAEICTFFQSKFP